eukprot:1249583-Rhodomonas_salina.2
MRVVCDAGPGSARLQTVKRRAHTHTSTLAQQHDSTRTRNTTPTATRSQLHHQHARTQHLASVLGGASAASVPPVSA